MNANRLQIYCTRLYLKLINENTECPLCGGKTSSVRRRDSKFHAALTDHSVAIQRRRCKCGWNSPDTVDGIYGSALHPDLVEKQTIQVEFFDAKNKTKIQKRTLHFCKRKFWEKENYGK